MFRFANPEFLYLLLILPALIVFYIYAVIQKRRAVKRYGNPALLVELMPDVSPKRQHLKFWLSFAAIALLRVRSLVPSWKPSNVRESKSWSVWTFRTPCYQKM